MGCKNVRRNREANVKWQNVWIMVVEFEAVFPILWNLLQRKIRKTITKISADQPITHIKCGGPFWHFFFGTVTEIHWFTDIIFSFIHGECGFLLRKSMNDEPMTFSFLFIFFSVSKHHNSIWLCFQINWCSCSVFLFQYLKWKLKQDNKINSQIERELNPWNQSAEKSRSAVWKIV